MLIEIAKSYQTRLRQGDTTLILPILAYYGTGRLWDYHWKKQTDIFGTNTRTTGRIKLTGVAVLPPAIQDVLNFEGHALEQMGKRKISLV